VNTPHYQPPLLALSWRLLATTILTATVWATPALAQNGLADSAQRNLETMSRYLSAQDMKTADAMADDFSRTYKLPSSFDSLD